MTSKRFLTATFVLSILVLCAAAFADSSPTLRVGLLSGIGRATTLTISCTESFDVMDAATQSVISTIDSGSITFSAAGEGIEIDQMPVSSPATSDASPSEDIVPGSSGDPTQVGDVSHKCRTFAGPVRLLPKDGSAVFTIGSSKRQSRQYGGDSLSVVDELSLEDYVRGVIPIEVPKNFQPEAQKALVIAIRTYALTSIGGGHHKSAGFDLCDCTDCQCFAGATKDAPWIDKLIDCTRGQVIVYNGALIHATYSTDCGGVTRSNEDAGFGKDPWPYLRSVVDNPSPALAQTAPAQPAVGQTGAPVEQAAATNAPADYCAGDPFHNWKKEFTTDDLDRIFARSPSLKIGKFQSMEFSEFDSSGRVKTVTLKGDQGEAEITGNRFRDLLGRDGLKSTLMTLTVSTDGRYTINGKGFGHGVGLCAFGANGMAKSDPKVTYLDILKHYYTGVEVVPLTNDLLAKKKVAQKKSDSVRKTTPKPSRNAGDGPRRPGSIYQSNPYDF